MKAEDLQAVLALPLILLVAGILAWAGSQGGPTLGTWPLYAWGIALALSIQWLAFIPAYLLQSEKFYDLTGSLTYLAVISLAIYFTPVLGLRSLILYACIAIWALRLGSFLFWRIQKAGEDRRFRELKPHFWRFLMAWTLQGLWVSFSLAAALVCLSSGRAQQIDIWLVLGSSLWLLGFGIEISADQQKTRFRQTPTPQSPFIQTGLWAWSRHPNYFGEMTLWLGIFLISIPSLMGWNWLSVLSPIFVYLLLTRISGVPLLEAHADQKWGGQADYEAYKAKTPVFWPRPPRKN